MNHIASLLPLDNVVAALDASSKKRVFEDAGILFENHQGIARSVVYEALFAREKLGSTALGQGIAIPHGRIKGLKKPLGAFFRLEVPVQFEAPDGKPVSHIFVLLVPTANPSAIFLYYLYLKPPMSSTCNCYQSLRKCFPIALSANNSRVHPILQLCMACLPNGTPTNRFATI